jgi:G:T-mismatch repair DNA endonuclease (very short patch repair protein)
LSYFIKKHGEEKGREIWENRNRAIGLKNAINKTLPFQVYSEEANSLFRQVCERGNISEALYGDKEQILFLTKEDAKVVGQNIIRPDFLYGNKVIEYNGSKWHANPLRYKEQDTPNPYREGKTSKEIWEKDAARIRSLENLGYQVLIIWDTEYKNNTEEVLQKCLSFLKEKEV